MVSSPFINASSLIPEVFCILPRSIAYPITRLLQGNAKKRSIIAALLAKGR